VQFGEQGLVTDPVEAFFDVGIEDVFVLLVKPTVSLDVISLVASSCGYYRRQIKPRAAH
jgi:hypothetical protein